MVRNVVDSTQCAYIPTLQRDQLSWISLSAALAQLFVLMDKIDWRQVFLGCHPKMTDLPGYPLKSTSFTVPYKESVPTTSFGEQDFTRYTMTGLASLPRFTAMQSSQGAFVIESNMDILRPFIIGHKVGSVPICPASVFRELAMEAGHTYLEFPEKEVLLVHDIHFASSLIATSSETQEVVRVRLSKNDGPQIASFDITSGSSEDAQGIRYCSGGLTFKDRDSLKKRWYKDAMMVKRQRAYLLDSKSDNVSTFQTKVLYEAVFMRVVRYSKEYQSLHHLSVSTTSLEGTGSFQIPRDSATDNFIAFPVFTDTLLHAAGFIANLHVSMGEICICASIESVEILYTDINYTEFFTVYCSLFDTFKGSMITEAFALNSTGQIVAIIRGMEFKKLRLSSFRKLLQLSTSSLVPNSKDD